MPTPLTRLLSIPSLSAVKAYEKLTKRGYTSVDQVISTARIAPKTLNDFLGVNFAETIQAANIGVDFLHEAYAAVQLPKFKLGAILKDVRPYSGKSDLRLEAQAAALAPKISLIGQLPPIRDQGGRGTCVAFGTLAAFETNTDDYSEQFVYAICKQRDGRPNEEGTWLAISYPVVRDLGVCQEATLPYNPNTIAGNEGQGPAPAGATTEAAKYKRNFTQLPETSVDSIKSALASGHVVSFTIPVFDSWYMNTAVAESGSIVMPIPGEQPSGGHAMAFVGYMDDASAPGGGSFQIRNSWDGHWATQSTIGVGYGTIPYEYIAQYGKEAYHFV